MRLEATALGDTALKDHLKMLTYKSKLRVSGSPSPCLTHARCASKSDFGFGFKSTYQRQEHNAA